MLGGAIGSALRYLLNIFVKIPNTIFPFGTLTANIIACFVIGWGSTFITNKFELETNIKLFLLTGICGGLSTFSTYTLETIELANNGKANLAIIYGAGSIVICFISYIFGLQIAK